MVARTRTLPLPDVSDPPFKLGREPLVTVLELPVPPSVNRIWRTTGAGKGYKSKTYTDWLKHADLAIVVDRKVAGRKVIAGPFSAIIEIRKPPNRCDIDNRVKAVLDFCQSRGFIVNDRDCQCVTAKWSFEPLRGCRVTLREEVP